MKIDHTEITIRLMNEDFTAQYLQENAELIQATIESTQQALSKSSVVQQRELLQAFASYLNVEYCYSADYDNDDVEQFLNGLQ